MRGSGPFRPASRGFPAVQLRPPTDAVTHLIRPHQLASYPVVSRFAEQVSLAGEALRRRLRNLYQSLDLEPDEVAVLDPLRMLEQTGCSQRELATAARLPESSLCNLVDRLHLAGKLRRMRSRQDRRKSVLVLTEAGRQLIERVDVARAMLLAEWFADATDEQLMQCGTWLMSCVEQGTPRGQSVDHPCNVETDGTLPLSSGASTPDERDNRWKEAG
jgi:DNA-binding MarR family transcriptional regulator